MTVREILETIARTDPAQVAGLGLEDAVILFDLRGQGGGRWTLRMVDGALMLEEGESLPPRMTLSAEADDFVALATGKLNPMAAFMQGKLQISGDMSLALRLQSLLSAR